ncbi:MAG: (Fe-S)-binding protein, partial [Cloacibacterium caeni]
MSENLIVPTMAEMMAEGKQPEILFWVGSAGSFDDRAKKISRAFVKILNKANVNF